MIPKAFQPKFIVIFLAPLLLVFGPQITHSAEQTNGCHCFRNRTFTPDNTFISDGYLQATVFNSLLASEFNISKRQIIMMKMREGVANNDLVTALYLAQITDMEVQNLLTMKKKQTWKAIAAQLATLPSSKKVRDVFNFIAMSSSDDQVTEHIINLIITSRFSPSQESLKLLSDKDLSLREIIIVYTLSSYTGVPEEKIADRYLNKGLSWSEIAYNFGLQPADVGKLFASVVKENKMN